MQFGVIGDLHGRCDDLAALVPLLDSVDGLLFVGDFGVDRSLPPSGDRHMDTIRRALDHAGDRPVFFVPGNHDHPKVTQDLTDRCVDERIVSWNGLRIAGNGGAGPAHFGFPYEWTDEGRVDDLRATFEGAGSVDILLTHAPPRNTSLDCARGNRHVGSEAVWKFVEWLTPTLVLCGHIHEAEGVEELEGGTIALNTGSLGSPYGKRRLWRVTWENGPQKIERVSESGSERVWE